MTYLDTLHDKKIIVLGLGVTGQGIIDFLISQSLLPKVVDSREHPPGQAWLSKHNVSIETYFGELDGAGLTEADVIIISPGIPLYQPNVQEAIEQGVEVIGDIELFARINNKPVVAVTGSNGKSTVVSLAEAVLKEAGLHVALGGNIGTSVLSLISEDIDVYVLELSSFQLEVTSSLVCRSAMILNVTEDHMDRYPDFAAYTAAKQRIYLNAEQVVTNLDDSNTHYCGKSPSVSVSLQGADYSLERHNDDLCFSGPQKNHYIPVSTLNIAGNHNQFNALAVMALLSTFDIPKTVYEAAFSAFKGLAHRCEFVSEHQGIRVFNDSKATNVGATVSAIESLADKPNQIVLIAGGDAKGADLSPLREVASQFCKHVICFGQDADRFMELHDHVERVNDLSMATYLAFKLAQAGDIILLAPACASIDMFPNYMARGEEFVRLVGEHTL